MTKEQTLLFVRKVVEVAIEVADLERLQSMRQSAIDDIEKLRMTEGLLAKIDERIAQLEQEQLAQIAAGTV